jgi:hypothetical protein
VERCQPVGQTGTRCVRIVTRGTTDQGFEQEHVLFRFLDLPGHEIGFDNLGQFAALVGCFLFL